MFQEHVRFYTSSLEIPQLSHSGMRKISRTFFATRGKGPSYLIRVAIKRTPGGPNNFNETRIFVERGQ